MDKIIIIDNYDSFTYNLFHLVSPLVNSVSVMKNDQINYDLLSKSNGIILSPGPGLPKNTNDLMSVISKYHQTHKILGVCLGHQSIAEFFGGKLENLDIVKHGVSSKINVLDNQCLYKDLPNRFSIGHYHSWVVKELHNNFIITAKSEMDEIMSFRHKDLKLFGLQFHPESILTEHGTSIIKNWINHH